MLHLFGYVMGYVLERLHVRERWRERVPLDVLHHSANLLRARLIRHHVRVRPASDPAPDPGSDARSNDD